MSKAVPRYLRWGRGESICLILVSFVASFVFLASWNISNVYCYSTHSIEKDGTKMEWNLGHFCKKHSQNITNGP